MIIDSSDAILDLDFDRVGVAKEIVQIAQDLLVGADEEDTEVVGFIVKLMRG